ncbi:YbfB/YjiJ family MFS transporter [Dongia sedimenti]|uniref:YbfB/YjiJ family MFS transporter n=1 Tax=Dongia sedimenti TaxID=3064282 RepID=A0ABU0YIS4_9PROT|nr:YbfB/YjiJ family MFS transporter [Rhodospirillaceae bacterium R-7]
MTTRAMPDHAPISPSLWRATLSGLSGSLVGIGLARFSYTPLLPAIIAAGWFDPSAAAYLGAANLAGYLGGALLAAPLASRFRTAAVLNAMMLLATAAFFASAWPIDFAWFFVWRFASGLAGGVIMVLAATSILPHIAPARRGLVSGAIFMGVGLGIAASGTLVPLLLRQGLSETWIGLGMLSLVLTALAWGGWPKHAASGTAAHHPHAPRPSLRLRALYVEYGLNAAGLVAHLLFLVDYVARGRNEGLAAGAEYWVLFGIGAVLGPVISGQIADRIGFGATLRLAFVIQAIAVLVPAINPNEVALMLSSFVVGAFTPGIVPIVLGRVHELLPHAPAQQKAAWSRATTSFAVLQAAAAYGMSYLFAHDGGNYALLFILAAAATLLALVIDLAAGRSRR